MNIKKVLPVLAALSLVMVVAACGSDEEAGDGSASNRSGTLEISGVWARNSPMVVTRGAVYLTVENGTESDDALVGVSVAKTVAAKAELHETVEAEGASTSMASGGGSTPSSMGGTGMMEMRPVDRIPVPAGGRAVLAPGGYHIMLIDLAEPLADASTISVTLKFERAGTKLVDAEVRADAP